MRRALAWSAAILALAFVLVLSVPDRDRALALYAFLLLAGGLALSLLLFALARAPLAHDGRLAGVAAIGDSQSPQLAALTDGVRATLRERALDDRVDASIRAVATVRLARNHGIELEREPARAGRVLGDGLLLRLLDSERPRGIVRIDGGELAQIVDQLERL